jgi:hypothetical protein
MKKIMQKLFGGLNITWPKLIVFAIAMGIYTALMAMLAPDGNSFHDIAVTLEWWFLPAILIIINSKKPLEAAAKVFVFFLISQPLVYLVQVPFNYMGWGLFNYYGYWFKITLLTLPAGYLGWYMKKDKWYSGLILSCATAFLAYTGISYAKGLVESFPDHLLSTIYCFGIIPVFIFGIFRDKVPRIVSSVITIAAMLPFLIMPHSTPYETINASIIKENDIVFVGEPYVSAYTTEAEGKTEIFKNGLGDYTIRVYGLRGNNYSFTISDDENNYNFIYYFDDDSQSVIIKKQ